MSSDSTFDALLEQYLERGTEISRLEAENARLREALFLVLDLTSYTRSKCAEVNRRCVTHGYLLSCPYGKARAALETTRSAQAPVSAKPEVKYGPRWQQEDGTWVPYWVEIPKAEADSAKPEADVCGTCGGRSAGSTCCADCCEHAGKKSPEARV